MSINVVYSLRALYGQSFPGLTARAALERANESDVLRRSAEKRAIAKRDTFSLG